MPGACGMSLPQAHIHGTVGQQVRWQFYFYLWAFTRPSVDATVRSSCKDSEAPFMLRLTMMSRSGPAMANPAANAGYLESLALLARVRTAVSTVPLRRSAVF